MLLLDTDVISELRKAGSGRADPNVTDWANSVAYQQLFISVISLLELEMGILNLERRGIRQGAILRKWLETSVLPAFEGRILAIDARIALQCARLHVPDRMSERDALIAATGIVHQMTVVTRNTSDFQSSAVKVLNPWV